MVVSGSPERWDRWHIIPQLAVYNYHLYNLYTTYSPCRTWAAPYATYHPTELRGTRNNH